MDSKLTESAILASERRQPEKLSNQWAERTLSSAVPARFHKTKYSDIKDESEAIEQARQYIKADDGWCFIYGRSGSGKTMLASVMVRDIILSWRKDAKRVNAAELMLQLRETMSGNGSESAIIDRYSKAEVLILDDLGAIGSTDYALASIYLILNRRSESAAQTIITSNLSIEDISKKIDVRIADRILRELNTTIQMKNGSYNIRIRK